MFHVKHFCGEGYLPGKGQGSSAKGARRPAGRSGSAGAGGRRPPNPSGGRVALRAVSCGLYRLAAAWALADKTSPFSSKTQTALGSIPIKEISCSTPSGVLEFLEKNENSLLAMCFPRARVVAAPGGPCFLYANKFTAHLQGKTNAEPRGRLPPPLQRRAGSFYTRRKAGWKGLGPRRAE